MQKKMHFFSNFDEKNPNLRKEFTKFDDVAL